MYPHPQGYEAPELQVAHWFNTDAPITLASLRAKVVVLHAFQMLCPGCVADGLPQAMRVQKMFSSHDVVVLGLHTVFEHHAAMTPHALKAFLHEYRITFPVGVDTPAVHGPVPATMHAYGLQGTPSVVVIDRNGLVRLNHFGHLDDLLLGGLLGTLLSTPMPPQRAAASAQAPAPVPALAPSSDLAREGCNDTHCATPRRA